MAAMVTHICARARLAGMQPITAVDVGWYSEARKTKLCGDGALSVACSADHGTTNYWNGTTLGHGSVTGWRCRIFSTRGAANTMYLTSATALSHTRSVSRKQKFELRKVETAARIKRL